MRTVVAGAEDDGIDIGRITLHPDTAVAVPEAILDKAEEVQQQLIRVEDRGDLVAYCGCGLQPFGLFVQGIVRSFQLAALEKEFQEDAYLA